MTVRVRERRPVVAPCGARLDEQVVPGGLRVAVHPERHRAAARRNLERAGQPLVGGVRRLREQELGPGSRGDRGQPVRCQGGGDGVPVLDAGALIAGDVELPDRHRGEVAGHRLDRVPRPGRRRARRRVPGQDSVGDRLDAHRDRDVERVGGAVARVVVGGEPRRRDVRLADDHGAVGRGDEARATELVEHLRHAVVAHHDGEARPVRDPGTRPDGELARVAAPRGRPSVDLDGAHREPDEVEVERGQVLGRAGRDGGDALEDVGVRRVADREVVVGDVVAAVAVEGVVRIADPWRPGAEPRCRGRAGGGQQGDEETQDSNEHGQLARHRDPPRDDRHPRSRGGGSSVSPDAGNDPLDTVGLR